VQSSAQRTVEAVWRIESTRIIGALTRVLRDVGLAEELAQEALVHALEQWPAEGVPDNPGAWLMTAAKRRAVDVIRRKALHERLQDQITWELETRLADAAPDLEAAIERAFDDPIGDEPLRLMFIACHPVLSREARTALTLRLLGGLSTDEIARAFLVSEATVAQRIVRAKRTLSEARVPFELPPPAELAERLASVLEVIYLVFNEGYAATAGEHWTRPALAEEALRLGRILAQLAAGEPEVHGLVALMEIQASRLRARTGPAGEPILLLDQDRTRWDPLLIRRGLTALERAEALAGKQGGLGPYALQAAIAACHARARSAEATDWPRIAALYDALALRAPSPVVELNRAVALAMAFGPAAGLEVVDALRDEPQLTNYHLLPSVRGDLLIKLGRRDEAQAEFKRAASLTRNERERALLLTRAAACAVSGPRPVPPAAPAPARDCGSPGPIAGTRTPPRGRRQ
jgi:RNA polymerase sigma factor (sigma-70 family)